MESARRRHGRRIFGTACLFALSLALTSAARAQQPATALSRGAAVQQALLQNPYLTTIRKQSGYGEAALMIARTYPFNPVYTGYVTGTGGPISSAITNRVYLEQYVSLELELRGQGKHRKAGAAATVSRIEWENAQQEIAVSIAVIRAFNTVLYRQKKIEFIDAGLKINESALERLRKQVDAGKAKTDDLMLARIDFAGVRAQRGQALTALTVARSELRKQMGTLDDTFVLAGDLDVPLPSTDPAALTQLAISQRADLQARRSAICEAEAALRLVNANRYGNPSFGPFFEYDPTRTTYVGGRLSMPLAIFNTKKGELHKAETDVARIHSEVQQMELQASQDVQAALSRWTDANNWATSYRTDVLPNLGKARQEAEKQFTDKSPDADFARLVGIQRSYLKASENLLDARFEVSQAQADLALSVAEPALAIGPGQEFRAPAPMKQDHGSR
jgi:outer membrane protein TolC